MRSPVAPITRSSDKPIVRVPPSAFCIGAMCQGSRISADQVSPSSLVAWRQSLSQSLLKLFSLVIVLSVMLPDSSRVTL
jgi:hypothetical protein